MGVTEPAGPERSGPGRPLSHELHRAVIEATKAMLLNESVGSLSIKGIADASGVSRPAIYRRWSSPREIALDAFLEMTAKDISVRPDGPADVALADQIKAMVQFLSGRGGQLAAELVGEGQSDPELLAMFRGRFLNDRRKEAKAIIKRGVRSGRFRGDIDEELAVDLYAGPIYYRLMVKHEPLDEKFARELTDLVVRAFDAG